MRLLSLCGFGTMIACTTGASRARTRQDTCHSPAPARPADVVRAGEATDLARAARAAHRAACGVTLPGASERLLRRRNDSAIGLEPRHPHCGVDARQRRPGPRQHCRELVLLA